MFRTYSSYRTSHFFPPCDRLEDNAEDPKFLPISVSLFLHSFFQLLFLAYFHFLRCLSFIRTFIAIVHTAWPFEIVVSNYDISTRYLYIYISVGFSLAYTILPFVASIHSLKGERVYLSCTITKRFILSPLYRKRFLSVHDARGRIDLRKIYLFPYIF